MKMAKAKQITVWVESTPGQMGRVAKALGEAKINITAFTAYTTGGESPIRLQVSSPAKAKKILADLGLRVTEEEVLRVTLTDKPGMLGDIGTRLGNAGIQVEYAYASLGAGSRKADVVLGVADLAGATKALRGV
jgi:hypothetical protein